MRWVDGINDSMDVNVSKLQDLVINRDAYHAAGRGATKIQILLSD